MPLILPLASKLVCVTFKRSTQAAATPISRVFRWAQPPFILYFRWRVPAYSHIASRSQRPPIIWKTPRCCCCRRSGTTTRDPPHCRPPPASEVTPPPHPSILTEAGQHVGSPPSTLACSHSLILPTNYLRLQLLHRKRSLPRLCDLCSYLLSLMVAFVPKLQPRLETSPPLCGCFPPPPDARNTHRHHSY